MRKSVVKGLLILLVAIFSAAAAGGTDTPVAEGVADSQDHVIAGTPWHGNTGIRETVDKIMLREHARELVSGPKVRRIIPLRTHPGRKNNPENPESPESPEWPVSRAPLKVRSYASSRGPFTPQTLSAVNFTGAALADTNAFPPDSMGAAGPTQYIVAVNGRIRSFNKTTGLADSILNVNTDTFFNSVMTPPASNNFTSDPRIRYDRLSGRWFIIMIDVPGGTGALPNRVMLAVSSGGTITGSSSFTFFFFQHDLVSPAGDTGEFADYPTLGIDTNALYIGVNVFSATGAFSDTTGFVVRKTSVIGAGPIIVTAFRGLVPTATSDGPFTPQGVDNYDPASTEGYFIGVSNASYGTLILRRVSDPGGSPSISANIPITVNSTYWPVLVPHEGNTGGKNGYLDAVDDRLFAAYIRNGMLWTAHNILVNSSGVGTSNGDRDGARWYELTGVASPGTPSVYQSGTVYDTAASNPRFYWIPSIMVSGQGHAAIGFSRAGTNEYANAGTVGRLAGDTAGTMQTPVLYTNSATAYNPPGDPGGSGGRRWGDYSYTSLDPGDDMTMWTIQEFCNAANSYGVQVVKLLAPPPATPSSASPSSIAAGQASMNVTVTGTSISGSGFFDPGAGFANHISASVSGITVNSATYTDPTHITLNLSTVGAAGGARYVTVTNPDSQSATSASAILTVCSTITIAPSTIPNGIYNTAYNQTFTASGGVGPYFFGFTGVLPAGMNFSAGTLSGTPIITGSFPFTVTTTDSNGCSAGQSYTLTINKADTTTTITSHTPDPSFTGQTVAINYTVTSSAGTPTGNVTVGDGTVSCTGTVAAGTCSLTFPTTGSKTLAAQYSGDSNFNAGASAGVTHTVTLPPVRIAGATPLYFATIQSAYDAAVDGATIQMQALEFTETVSFDRNVAVSMQGGYDSGYAGNSGTTSISGTVTINAGTVAVANVIVH